MVSALLYLKKSSDRKVGADQNTINTMFNLMKKIGRDENQRQSDNNDIPFTKRDVLMLNIVDSRQKYEVEKSRCYIGYKLIWIIKMFLEGR